MAVFRDVDKALFPLKDIKAVVKLFAGQLQGPNEPDLTLLSIVTGVIENQLTSRSYVGQNSDSPETNVLPLFELDTIENLYKKFHLIIKSAVEPNKAKTYATRELVKRVSDVIWNSLTRSYYKDKAHLQSLFSFLTGSKLDCFGVAFAVVAGCQVLGYDDVHLALSEDHAWVVFGGPQQSETAEVTWHGKGNEDKRGQEVGKGVSARSWLYVNNKPVVCTRQMEVAAIISAINPSLNANFDATEIALLQQELLWLMYDLGHLKKYPMALGNLGDLEEISSHRPEISCSSLYEEAIESARRYYNNQHVYPYTYQGGFYFRRQKYKEAFESWANASDVIRWYNYSRDDEEIYKEFLEIANEHIPSIMKSESSGFEAHTILKKPECFANLLKFYDGICQWEEGSATPVLHIGWAKPLVNTISKFDADVRAQVNIVCDSFEEKLKKNGSIYNSSINNNNYEKENVSSSVKPVLHEEQSSTSNFHPTIEALTAACSEKLLNPEFLLQGDGSPFVGGISQGLKIKTEAPEDGLENNGMESCAELDIKPETHIKQEDFGGEYTKPAIPVKKEEEEKENGKPGTSKSPDSQSKHGDYEEEPKRVRPTVVLHSQKMKQLKDLLLAEKLNTHAISLHLTAQSQVQVGKKGRSDSIDTSTVRPKRSRRD